MITKKIAREILQNSKKVRFWKRVITSRAETDNALGRLFDMFGSLQLLNQKNRIFSCGTITEYMSCMEREKRLAKLDRIRRRTAHRKRRWQHEKH